MASPRTRASETRGLLSGGGGGSQQSHPPSLRRLLQPTTANILLWIPLIAITCVLISIVSTYSRLEADIDMRDMTTGTTHVPPDSPWLHTPLPFLRQVARTSSVGFEGGNALLRPPTVIPAHEHDLGQKDSDLRTRGVGANDPPVARVPLIQSSSRAELLRRLVNRMPRADPSPYLPHPDHHMAPPTQINSADKYAKPSAEPAPGTDTPAPALPPDTTPVPSPALPSLTSDADVVIPLLVFTFNRPENLRRTLDSLLEHRPSVGHPIFISQDGDDAATRRVAQEYATNADNNPRWTDIHYINFHWETMHVVVEPEHRQWQTYYKIATHYGWALRQVLDGGLTAAEQLAAGQTAPYDHVILIEDDMSISPDFYAYFRRMRRLLDADESLLCVSAWNDNGRRALVSRPTQLYRSDCFPGLGWLLNRRVWNEMREKWPKGFWDDWLREPQQRQGRSCIFPEINRVFTFGEKGSSAGQFYDQYLRGIVLNSDLVDWQSEDLSYLSSRTSYRRYLWERISAAQVIGIEQIDQARGGADARIHYNGLRQLDGILNRLNMMVDHKAGIPRTSFEGVLALTRPESNSRVWIVPDQSDFMQTQFTP